MQILSPSGVCVCVCVVLIVLRSSHLHIHCFVAYSRTFSLFVGMCVLWGGALYGLYAIAART
jgi:hypothetical protein